MNRGYVKLWRKSLEAGWLKNKNLWAFWCWCLLKASHKEIDVIVGYQAVHLMPGDFIFGRKKAAEDLDMGEQSVRTNLDFLRTSKNLTIKVTNKYSIISIVNWNAYQDDVSIPNHQSNQPVTNNQPASNQQVTTNKNVKNVKNTPYTPEFESFWSAYPRKVAKGEAWKAWRKQNGNRPALEVILGTIEKWKQADQWQKEGGQFIPHPATWLNDERWHDDTKIQITPKEEAWKAKIPFIGLEAQNDHNH